MRKIKIVITILALYEFIILTILQVPNYCSVFFSLNFCAVSFKFFLLCIMIPALVGLFIWWMPDIGKLFCHNCKCNNSTDTNTTNQPIQEIISKQDIERFITMAVIIGIQKFVSKYPKAKETFDTIFDIIKNAVPQTAKKHK